MSAAMSAEPSKAQGGWTRAWMTGLAILAGVLGFLYLREVRAGGGDETQRLEGELRACNATLQEAANREARAAETAKGLKDELRETSDGEIALAGQLDAAQASVVSMRSDITSRDEVIGKLSKELREAQEQLTRTLGDLASARAAAEPPSRPDEKEVGRLTKALRDTERRLATSDQNEKILTENVARLSRVVGDLEKRVRDQAKAELERAEAVYKHRARSRLNWSTFPPADFSRNHRLSIKNVGPRFFLEWAWVISILPDGNMSIRHFSFTKEDDGTWIDRNATYDLGDGVFAFIRGETDKSDGWKVQLLWPASDGQGAQLRFDVTK